MVRRACCDDLALTYWCCDFSFSLSQNLTVKLGLISGLFDHMCKFNFQHANGLLSGLFSVDHCGFGRVLQGTVGTGASTVRMP